MMTVENFKKFLQSRGINPNKTYGQNFLMNDVILEDIVDAASISKDETVVEVGPGIGNMTEKLSERAGKVVVVEKDEQFRNILFGLARRNKNVKLFFGDVLTTNFWEEVEGDYKVVANIPYYITGKIIQLFLRAEHKPKSLTLLTQKEVAENIVAEPGHLNLLGVSVQLVGEGKIISVVPKESFFPPPKVMSAVVQIKLFPKPKLHADEEKKFFKLLKAAFLGKRKQLHNSLSSNLKLDHETVSKNISGVGLVTNTRPQEISVETWIELYKKMKNVL